MDQLIRLLRVLFDSEHCQHTAFLVFKFAVTVLLVFAIIQVLPGHSGF